MIMKGKNLYLKFDYSIKLNPLKKTIMHKIIIILMLLYLHPFKHLLTDRFHNNFTIDKIIAKNLIKYKKPIIKQ